MNRGSDTQRLGRGGLRDASMRPRFMNRGSSDYLEVRGNPLIRFNEAPIHESGK